jgi:hypothetical protein
MDVSSSFMHGETASGTSRVGGWMWLRGENPEFGGDVIRSFTVFPIIYSLSNPGSRSFTMISKQRAPYN